MLNPTNLPTVFIIVALLALNGYLFYRISKAENLLGVLAMTASVLVQASLTCTSAELSLCKTIREELDKQASMPDCPDMDEKMKKFDELEDEEAKLDASFEILNAFAHPDKNVNLENLV